MGKPTAIVLGGTVPHKFLVENLKGRGYQALLVDYYENPPAASVADQHIRQSTLDQNAVLEIAKQAKASLVISGCVDQANLTACYVAEKLGLPLPYSYDTALRVTDKALMKAGMVNAKVTTAEHEVITGDQVSSYSCNTFPKVVKPCDCNGSKGVRKVETLQDLKLAAAAACKLSRTNRAIIEDFNPGIEVSGYFYIGDDDVSLIYAKRKNLPRGSGISALQSFLSVGPERISENAAVNFKGAVARISKEFGLLNTPMLVQANIDGDDVRIIEFAPRVGGGLAFREILKLTDFDFIDSVVNSYLGKKTEVLSDDASTDSISVIHLYGSRGKFSHLVGMEDLIADGIVEECHLHKMPGMEMSCDDLSSRNRVLGAIITFKTDKELCIKIEALVKRLSIINNHGNDVFYREVLG